MKWVEMHVSDASAVHYLVLVDQLLSDREGEGKEPRRGKHDCDCDSQSDTQLTYDHALALVRTYPMHQALWMHLRAAYCAPSPSGDQGLWLRLQPFRLFTVYKRLLLFLFLFRLVGTCSHG